MLDALAKRGISATPHGLDLVETTTLHLDVETASGPESVRVEVTRWPAGENPETYLGAEQWTIDLHDENDELLDRMHNPADSFDDAVSNLDWDRIRARLT